MGDTERIAGLWKTKSNRGFEYLSGTIKDRQLYALKEIVDHMERSGPNDKGIYGRIMAFQVVAKEKPNYPDYDVVIAPGVERERDPDVEPEAVPGEDLPF